MKNEKNVKRIRKAAFLCVALGLFSMCAFATGGDVNAADMFSNIIATACQVFQFLGAFLMVYALGSLFMAFRDENAESKSKAGMYLLVAILLISVPTIYETAVGSQTGLSNGTSLLEQTGD